MTWHSEREEERKDLIRSAKSQQKNGDVRMVAALLAIEMRLEDILEEMIMNKIR